MIDADVEIGQDTRDRAVHQPARATTRIGAGLDDRAARDGDRHTDRRRGDGRPLLREGAPTSATASASDRSHTCAPAPSCARARRPARSSRSRTPTSAPARRSRICPTSATPTSASSRTSAPGTITANYDGYRKHRTTIGSRVKVSVDTTLRRAGDRRRRRLHGAGSVISKDVPAGALGVARARQQNIEGYAERRKQREAASSEEASREAIRERRHVTSRRTLAGRMSVLQTRPVPPTDLRVEYDKRLMLVSGPRQPGAGGEDRRQARRRARRRDAQDVRQRRGLLPLRGVGARGRRVHRAADLRESPPPASAPTTR